MEKIRQILTSNKLLIWSFVVLILIKLGASYGGFQIASIINGFVFPKEDIVEQTNAYRGTLGLEPLKENSLLDAAATQKLQDMIKNQYFAHFSPGGISPWFWYQQNGYKYSTAGENLAIGFISAQETVGAWVDSPSHRSNLTNPKYKEIGVAVSAAKINDSEGVLVVQLFGAPQKTAPANKQAKPAPTPIRKTPALDTIPTTTPVSEVQPNIIADKPIALMPTVTPLASQTAKVFNNAYLIYSLVLFLAMISFMAFSRITKELVFRVSASLALLVLAVLIPVYQIARPVLIF